MREIGGRGWSVHTTGAADLAFALAVRECADLPYYDDVPEPLTPAPPPIRLQLSRAVRESAAEQWGAWWRITLAQRTAAWRERVVLPEPPLCGLSAGLILDPPKFGALAAAPELKQVVSTTWPQLRDWGRNQLRSEVEPSRGNWPLDLVTLADADAGRPIRDVTMHLEILPVAGSNHWLLTEDVDRAMLHAVVSADLATAPANHFPWLRSSLARIGAK